MLIATVQDTGVVSIAQNGADTACKSSHVTVVQSPKARKLYRDGYRKVARDRQMPQGTT